MASGDKILEFSSLPVVSHSDSGPVNSDSGSPVFEVWQTSKFGFTETASTPSGGDYKLRGPVELTVGKSIGGGSNAVTLFDPAKTYKITVTEV